VERPQDAAGSSREHLTDVLAFAAELGAETALLSGPRVSDELIAYARSRNASRIVVGKPSRPRWREALFGSLVNALVRQSSEIDVLVLSSEEEDSEVRRSPPRAEVRPPWQDFAASATAVLACTLVAALMHPYFESANLIMVYLVGVMWVAVRLGRGPAVLASILSVAAFDFFFVPPRFTLAISDTQYLVTFSVMLGAAILIGT